MPPLNEDSVTLTLSRALQIKSRLAGRLAKAQQDLTVYNSQPAGEDEVNVAEIEKLRQKMTAAMLDLKIAIHRANVEAGVQAKVFLIGEKRSEVALLQGLKTTHGKVASPYGNQPPTEYKAFIRKQEADERVRKLEVEIDDLQQEINDINATKKITIPAEVVSLTR